jgi:NAD(P)H-flavin reductase
LPLQGGILAVTPTLFPQLRLHPDRTVALVCGSEIMMRYVILQLEHRGVPVGASTNSLERLSV